MKLLTRLGSTKMPGLVLTSRPFGRSAPASWAIAESLNAVEISIAMQTDPPFNMTFDLRLPTICGTTAPRSVPPETETTI
jgi:hypothetical protein